MSVETYLKRVPWQHKNRPKFAATLKAFLEPVCVLQDIVKSIPRAYDKDYAVGSQLDVVGEWVGRSRYIDKTLSGIYFTWDDTAETGWGAGQWKGKYDPTSGLVALDDDTYRTLINLQIAANAWDGTSDGAYDAWNDTFPNSAIVIEDHGDMTITIGIAGKMESTAQKALFKQQISPFKPGGVKIDIYFISKVDAPLFAWGLETDAMGGWDTAAWAEKFICD